MENIFIKKEIDTKVILKIVKKLDKVFLFQKQVKLMKEI